MDRGEKLKVFFNMNERYYGLFNLIQMGVTGVVDLKITNYYNNLGQYTKYKSSYTPKVGDLIFIDWEHKRGNISTIDHVGIVIAVEDGKVITVEGNYSDKVSCNTYALNDRSITGYATPKYK